MDKATVLSPLLLLLSSLILLVTHTCAEIQDDSEWSPHYPGHRPAPLCATQFALANRACLMLPFKIVPPLAPPSSGHHRHRHGHHHHHHHHRHEGTDEEQDEYTYGEGGTDEEQDEYTYGGGEHRRSRHRHGHGHKHRHKETQVEYDCCRWLKEIDSVCVCDMLVRLPAFLTRPVHEYNVVVDESCQVTFRCSSRVVRA